MHMLANDVMNRIVHTGSCVRSSIHGTHPGEGDVIPGAVCDRSCSSFQTGGPDNRYHTRMADMEQMKRWSMNVSWEGSFEVQYQTSGTALTLYGPWVTYSTEKQIQGIS